MMSRLRGFGVYELVAFVIGFCLMTYELVAARILGPTIGSSTYVWTSVIGVIIAALSLGYAFGGWLADKRVQASDVAWLLIASAAAVLMTLLIADDTLAIITRSVDDARLQGLLASVILFMPTSFLLGTISPYLARLRLHAVEETGKTIASLSALNSIGGIVGTFCTGFIFFSYIGSHETMLLTAGILMICSFCVRPWQQTTERIAAIIALGAVSSLAVWPNTQAANGLTIDTPSTTYKVFDTLYDGQDLRVLTMGPNGWQSGIYPDNPSELAFSYTRKMAEIVEAAPHKQNILILGGGAFTLPQYLAQKHPAAQIDVVEIDPKLIEISKQYFYYKSPANVKIFAEDARAFLNTSQMNYDIILVDVYSDTNVPFSLSTVEYTALLKESLTTSGVVAVNVIGSTGSACQPLLGAVHQSYLRELPSFKLYALESSDLNNYQNLIFAYSQRDLDWLPKARLVNTEAGLSSSLRLSDNFAPVERLKQACISSQV
jgi:predicted membrane-bound spermidine synthase